jgi:energy-converting hydrogenase B subunit D
MISRTILLLLLPVVAGIALSQARRLFAVIGMGIFSLLLAAVYLLLNAPDVAVTEAAIGAVLVTVIYVLAIRRTGRIVVVADEAPGLLSREGERLVGLEYEILHQFARRIGLDLSVRLTSYKEAEQLLRRGEADLRAGGVVAQPGKTEPATRGFLPTTLVRLSHREPPRSSRSGASDLRSTDYDGDFLEVAESVRRGRPTTGVFDLARFLHLSRRDLSQWHVERETEAREYVFHAAPHREDLVDRLNALLDELSTSGQLQRLIERFFP